MQKRKIPVFYHIPKNAGTYVSDWMLIAFRHYREIYTNWLNNHKPEQDSIKVIQVFKGNFIVARILVGDPNRFSEFYESDIFEKYNNRRFNIDIKDLSNGLFQNTFIFGIIIESHGFKIRQQVLNFVKGYNLVSFLILRDPFSRAQSIYNYNTSIESINDYFHNMFDSNTFEKYILSNQLEDSWLIRNLLDLKDSEIIEKHHYNEATSLLTEFSVYNIKETDKAIHDIFELCYGFDIGQIKLKAWDNINKNETTIKKILPKDLSLEALETFKRRTFFDQKLYDLYV